MSTESTINKVIGKIGKACGFFFVPSSKDTYLISHPRSGNSWLRSAVAEMMFGESGERLTDIYSYVPTVGFNMPVWKLKPASFHVVRSHEYYMLNTPTEMYHRVIYIIRDPRDVALSYFRFLTQSNQYSDNFDGFLDDWLNNRIWPSSWVTHVNSWTAERSPEAMSNILILTYDRMLSDTPGQFRRVADFLHLTLTDNAIKNIIQKTSIEQLRKKEDRNKQKISGFRSIQTGGVKKWKAEMTKTQAQYIVERCGYVMSRFGFIHDDA